MKGRVENEHKSCRKQVSVLVAAYNGQDVVLDALMSVARQTYRPIELIVVDDGSMDDTGKVVKAWFNENETESLSVRYEYKENEGLLSSRNRGLELSAGEYIQYLDQDDVLHPLKLEMCVDAIEEHGADMAVCCFQNFRQPIEIEGRLNETPRLSTWVREHGSDESRAYLVRAFWGYLSPVFARTLSEKAGKFPEGWSICSAEEVEFHLRVKLCDPKIVYVDRELAYHRIRGGSITHDTQRVVRECSLANVLMVWTLISDRKYIAQEWKHLAASSLKLVWRSVRFTRDPFAFVMSVSTLVLSTIVFVVTYVLRSAPKTKSVS